VGEQLHGVVHQPVPADDHQALDAVLHGGPGQVGRLVAVASFEPAYPESGVGEAACGERGHLPARPLARDGVDEQCDLPGHSPTLTTGCALRGAARP
jgi:hypothetical protein